MASVNKVIVLGNLGRDPEVRYTPSGAAVCNLRIATTRNWKSKDSGEKMEETEWHSVVLYDRQAEIAGEYLKKGRPVYIEGRLKTRKWQDKEGVDRYTTEIVADSMQLLGAAPPIGPAAAAGTEVVVDRLRQHGRRHPVLTGAAPRRRHLTLRNFATSSADTGAPWLPQLARTWVSSCATSSLLSTVANGGMPNGRGLPAVLGGKPPSSTMCTRFAGVCSVTARLSASAG